jgi:hypothetical protein
VPSLTRRLGNHRVAIAGVIALVITTAWYSRLSTSTDDVTGVALLMAFYGAAMGLGLTSLTTAGMAHIAHEDAGVAGGLVNVFHHLGGALGLGILTTIFATAGTAHADPRELRAQRVSAAFTGGIVLAMIALAVTVLAARSRAAIRAPDTLVGQSAR